MPIARRGEVWLIDFGMARKTRPALVVSVALVQGITTFPTVQALHRLGTAPREAFDQVLGGLLRWLGCFPE